MTPADGRALTSSAGVDTNKRGQRLAELLLTSESWIHRRVERLEMEPTGECRRWVSVDFTLDLDLIVEGSQNRVLVPIAVMRKGPLRKFSLEGPNGKPTPILQTKENGQLSVELLIAMAQNLFGDAGMAISSWFEGACRAVVFASPSDAEDAWYRLQAMVTINAAGSSHLSGFLAIAEQLSTNFLMIIELEKEIAGQRTIVKYSYSDPMPLVDLVSVRPTITWKLPQFGAAASTHFEFEPPPLLLISKASFTEFETDASQGRVRDGLDERATICHFAAGPDNRFSRAEVVVELVPRRYGAVTASFTGSLAIFILLWAVLVVRWTRESFLGPLPVSGTSGATLLAAAGLLLTWVARTPEDWTVSQVLFAARRQLFATASLAVAASALLAVPVREPYRTEVWISLALLGTVNMLVSWLYRRKCR